MFALMLASVIIPAKNAGLTIGPLLRSLLMQNYRPLEIVVVVGGSSDNTKETVEEYVTRALNVGITIKLVEEESFRGIAGPAHARNIGMAKSGGEYFLFLDADFMLLKETDVGNVVKGLHDHPTVSVRVRPLIESWLEDQLALDDYQKVCGSNVHNYFAVRKDSLKGVTFDENLGFAEDLDFYQRLDLKPFLIDVEIGRHFPSSLKELFGQATFYGRTAMPFVRKNISRRLMIRVIWGYILPVALFGIFVVSLVMGELQCSALSMFFYFIMMMMAFTVSPKKSVSRFAYLCFRPLLRFSTFVFGLMEFLFMKRREFQLE